MEESVGATGTRSPVPSEDVPGHPPQVMSEKLLPTRRKPDPRAARTRNRLGNALIELLLTKPFDAITVQEVLDHARVSRSTFYEHYRDKNDLFLGEVDQFFAGMSTLLTSKNDPSERVAPVAELFAHVATARELYAVLVEAGRMHDVRELGEAHFARSIAARLERLPRKHAPSVEVRLTIAHALAGSLFSLLTWWVRQGMATEPAQMDRLFHTMIVGTP